MTKQFEGVRANKNLYSSIVDEVGRGDDYCVVSDSSRWYVDVLEFDCRLESRLPIITLS